jgi:hypothetical protein
MNEGAWDSIHSVNATITEGKTVKYNLVSTVLISMSSDNQDYGSLEIAGSITRPVRLNF